MEYRQLNFVSQVPKPRVFDGDRGLLGVSVDEGYRISRKGDYYYIGHDEFGGEVLEVHASRTNGGFLVEETKK
jgi:hypothetical protein